MSEGKVLIHLLFFAHLRELSEKQKMDLEIHPGTDVLELKKILADLFPRLRPAMDTIIISVNQEFAPEHVVIPAEAEVAVFPPVSGGAGKQTICKIVRNPLKSDDYIELITQPTTGGICTFTGTVRAITARGNPHQTVSLEYEAYVPMAEKKMQQIADEMRNRWPKVDSIVIVQRIGKIDAGNTSVLVICSAAHRDMGIFEAARFGIDRLKDIVPIWKKEVGPSGEEWIEGGYKPGEGD